MQLYIDFERRGSNKDDQPYHYQEIENLIKIEDSIQNLSRKSWEYKIEYYQNKDLPDDFIILDHENKNIILFLNQLRANPKKLTNGTQIIRHWLLGQTMNEQLPEEVNDIQLKPEEIKLFFQGSYADISSYRRDKPTGSGAINHGWILYHYDGKLFSDFENLTGLMKDYFEKPYYKYGDYNIRLSYGIVSEKHQRTDKKKMIEIVENLLLERGFEVKRPELLNDFSRNGEPILLWTAKNYIENTEYKAAVGINFGYDNGLSGYRLGLGLYFTDEDLLAQIDRMALRRKALDNESLNESYNFAYKPWIHHKNFGYVEKKYKKFITDHFDQFYGNLVSLLNKSKNQEIRHDHFVRQNMNLHRSDYSFMKDEKEKIINDTMTKYGSNKFSQFIAWQKIAESIDSGNSKKKSLAQFIASCVLGAPHHS